MTLLEFTVFGLYLSFLLAAIVTIQMLEQKRIQFRVEETEEKFVESPNAEEEPSSEEEETAEESPFNPETEPYTMTENPMLRHRVVDQELDMDAVD